MPKKLFQRGLSLLLKRQTNILSAAFVIMGTVIFSQVLGLVRQRLLVSIFGASDTLGVYLASSKLPDFLFQLIIAGALSSAFIPVFSDYLGKNRPDQRVTVGTLADIAEKARAAGVRPPAVIVIGGVVELYEGFEG